MKAEVNYRRSEGEEACQTCMHFREPEQCELVRGVISAGAVCDLWGIQAGNEDPRIGSGMPSGGGEVDMMELLF